ncbi:hypothetical protein KC717_02915 [Candidatus Dojkabacteria bacterium]|uniref:Uncharacterized protein n=1 Tax=Candidatus Dojkabacteria bacterium TaxID=2099670 RepID=A0A955L8I4_9BACT|nr:hypothetical protein [Candidatus Dojkabacteria bacterium]
MSKKARYVIIIVFAATLVMGGVALFIANRLNGNENISESPSEANCPAAGSCEFYDCNSQVVYSENCTSEIVPGFCCTNYITSSPSDRCNMKSQCEQPDLEDGVCENAGEIFNVCDRCSTGKSSRVRAVQGEVGCDYEYEICKVDAACGEVIDFNEEGTSDSMGEECSNDRDVGDEWTECCAGDESGSSRVITKNADCSYSIVEECQPDILCSVSETDAQDTFTPIETEQAQPESTEDSTSQEQQSDNQEVNSLDPDSMGESENTGENVLDTSNQSNDDDQNSVIDSDDSTNTAQDSSGSQSESDTSNNDTTTNSENTGDSADTSGTTTSTPTPSATATVTATITVSPTTSPTLGNGSVSTLTPTPVQQPTSQGTNSVLTPTVTINNDDNQTSNNDNSSDNSNATNELDGELGSLPQTSLWDPWTSLITLLGIGTLSAGIYIYLHPEYQGLLGNLYIRTIYKPLHRKVSFLHKKTRKKEFEKDVLDD